MVQAGRESQAVLKMGFSMGQAFDLMILYLEFVVFQVPKAGSGAPSIGTTSSGQRPRTVLLQSELAFETERGRFSREIALF